MTKTIAVIQSNYIPWRGYFDMIRRSDEFLILDNVQYTKGDWRNRNRIKTSSGVSWLTIPVISADRLLTKRSIEETKIADRRWVKKHVTALSQAYVKAPHFKEVASWLFPLFHEVAQETLLTFVNERLLRAIAARLGIATPIRRASDILDRHEMSRMDRLERIIQLCRAAGASRYLSGPAASVYLDKQSMTAAGLTIEWMDYSSYREYAQLWGPFEPHVSIVDLLFNTGERAQEYLERRNDNESKH